MTKTKKQVHQVIYYQQIEQTDLAKYKVRGRFTGNVKRAIPDDVNSSKYWKCLCGGYKVKEIADKQKFQTNTKKIPKTDTRPFIFKNQKI
jgi:hypothetical protein